MADDLSYRQIQRAVHYFGFDDKLRIREIDREADVRRSDRPSKKEKSSTKCRHENYDAIRLHISVRDSTICARRFRGGSALAMSEPCGIAIPHPRYFYPSCGSA